MGTSDCRVLMGTCLILHINNQENNALDYELFPETSREYNSNSFTSGLLNSSGISTIPRPSYNVPGWDTPVPVNYFKK